MITIIWIIIFNGCEISIMMSFSDSENLLNSRDVARLLDMSPDAVNEYARKEILPAFKAGRQWRFRRQDVTSFQEQMSAA